MSKSFIILLITLALIGLTLGNFLGEVIVGNLEKGVDNIRIHYSYFSDKSFSDKAYGSINNKPVLGRNIKGVIVNHHLLAANLIAETISSIATTSQVTIVLISPNHFSSGRGQILSSVYDWHTPYGILESNKSAILKLKENGIINVDEYPFEKEHGISGIVPFIKKSLPNSRIVPIIIKDNLSRNQLSKFVDSLYNVFGGNVIIAGSFDFSHFYPDDITQLYDKESISIISNFDIDNIGGVQVDARPGLEIVLRYMYKVGATHFNLLANTNSSQILHDPSIKEAVSYIDGFFTKE